MPMPFVAETSQTMVSPPYSSGTKPMLLQLALHAHQIRAGQIDFIDRHHDLHLRGAGVVHRLDGGGHDPVVGRDDQDDDVGDVGAARAHGGERLVARGIEEGEGMIAALDRVGAHVLGDAAGLARRDAGLADGIEQRGLAVIDMTHEGNDGRTRLQLGGGDRLRLRRLDRS